MKVRLSPSAAIDFAGIIQGIALENFAAAKKYQRHFRRRFKVLERFPLSGEACPHLAAELRRTTVRQYAIYYRIRPAEVVIARIIHGAQDHESLVQE